MRQDSQEEHEVVSYWMVLKKGCYDSFGCAVMNRVVHCARDCVCYVELQAINLDVFTQRRV